MSGITVKDCVTLFDLGRYQDCLKAVRALPQQDLSLSVVLMILTCHQRMGDTRGAASFGEQLLAATKKDKWAHSLTRLTLGTMSFDEASRLAGSDPTQLCQFYYYVGSRLMTQNRFNDAQEAFDQCLYTGADCLECSLAYFQITTIASQTRHPSQYLMAGYATMLRALEEHLEHGETAKADELAIRLIQMTRRDLTTHAETLADCLGGIAGAYRAAGSPEKALPLLEEAVSLMRDAPDRDAARFSEMVEALSSLYYKAGGYDKSEPLLREALDLYRNTVGESHESYVHCLNNLAAVCNLIGKHDEAVVLLEEALAHKARTVGTRHPSYATSVHNLAVAKQQKGDLQRAEALYREEIDILRRAEGDTSEDYTMALHALADVCQALGRDDEAEQLLLKAVASADVHNKS